MTKHKKYFLFIGNDTNIDDSNDFMNNIESVDSKQLSSYMKLAFKINLPFNEKEYE